MARLRAPSRCATLTASGSGWAPSSTSSSWAPSRGTRLRSSSGRYCLCPCVTVAERSTGRRFMGPHTTTTTAPAASLMSSPADTSCRKQAAVPYLRQTTPSVAHAVYSLDCSDAPLLQHELVGKVARLQLHAWRLPPRRCRRPCMLRCLPPLPDLHLPHSACTRQALDATSTADSSRSSTWPCVTVGCPARPFIRLPVFPCRLYPRCQLFAMYGDLDDVYIMRDTEKQSRGCGFIKFKSREAAEAAIAALNGLHIMQGSDQPLAVRFADVKRPRAADAQMGGPGLVTAAAADMPALAESHPPGNARFAQPETLQQLQLPWAPDSSPNNRGQLR
eukprot:SM000427S15761  [mRNA]  locus=s427:14800:19979:- [translate_table: standard]